VSRIPEDTIKQILAATDAVQLIGKYVKLRKDGANWVGLCPFHTERSPSFTVYPASSSYYCFGCGAAGSSFRFLMEQEGIQFSEAAQRLAEAAGITIQHEVWDAATEQEAKHRALLRRINHEVAQWYHELLLRHASADAARNYLKGRGLNSGVAKNWQIGYAPPSVTPLRAWARQHGYTEQHLVQAGLMTQNERGPWPAFLHRVMFPVRNESGEVIAFSGRALDPEAKAKYKNSPETAIFNKSRTLFGFDKAKKAIHKKGHAIVVEGQIDLIVAYEHGFENVTAALGTAFTEHHAKMLHRSGQEVILCYDADNAGFKAAERAHNILSPQGLVVRVARLPKGEDPDTLIRQQGKEVFAKILAEAVDFLDFQITHKRSALGNDLRHQVALVEQTALTIAMSPSIAARDLMIRSHAAQLGISEDALRQQVQQFARRQQAQKKREAEQQQQAGGLRDAMPVMSPAEEAKRLLASQQKVALQLTWLAMRDDEVLDWLRHQQLEQVLSGMTGCEMLFRLVRSSTTKMTDGGATAFLATLPAGEENAFVQLLASEQPKENPEEVLRVLQRQRLKDLIQKAQHTMRHATPEGAELVELNDQIQRWKRELTGI
jgi:DNA primase